MSVKTAVVEAVEESKNSKRSSKDLSLEALLLLLNTDRLDSLQTSIIEEFKTLKERQDLVSRLHNLLQAINTETTTDGELKIEKNKELQKLLKEAKTLGVEVKEGKTTFTVAERERLVENIRMTVEDLNTKNDMQLQKVTRLTNERYEMFQMVNSIFRPLHEAKMSKARAVSGR